MRRAWILGWMMCMLLLPGADVRSAPPQYDGPLLCPAADPAEDPPTIAALVEPPEKAASVKNVAVARIVIDGDYPEGPTAMGLFGDAEESLATLVQRIDRAADDADVAALWLKIEELDVGRGKLHELRSAVTRFRKSGKPVYAEVTDAEGPEYLLVAACDEIIMPPSGAVAVPGVQAEIMFYKGLLDKLGIRFDMLQMGKYKGAAEPFTRTSMSPALRESMEALVDDAYEELVQAIAAGRGMEDYQVKTLLDRGLFTPAAARKAGLIDRIAYADQFRQQLCKELKADEIEVLDNYKKKSETDFSGMSGIVKLMEIFSGSKKTEPVSKKQKIAVVYAVGPIVEGNSFVDIFGNSALGSSSLIAALRKAADDPTVLGIVLRVDSPGGSATASDLIWRETRRIEKPLVASMGDVAGSGGYYIAMGADKVFAEPGTITGSIGVVGGKIVLGGLYEKIGLTTEVIRRGKNSGSFSSTEPFTPEQRKAWTAMMKEIYRQFVRKAAAGRGLTYEELNQRAQGRVYSGRMAQAIGLVDELGTLADAIAEVKRAAGLQAEEEVELLILPPAKTIFDQIFGDSSVRTALGSLPPELVQIAQKARVFRRLFRGRMLLWMPYEVKLR